MFSVMMFLLLWWDVSCWLVILVKVCSLLFIGMLRLVDVSVVV